MDCEPSPHAAAHTPTAIHNRLKLGPNHNYLRDFVYGAIDGAVTTFAVVSLPLLNRHHCRVW
jgi:hypothetical protein